MQCSKCGKGIFPEIEAYMVSSIIMKEKDDYERIAYPIFFMVEDEALNTEY